MILAWGGILTPEERAALLAVAREVGCDPSHLAAVIAFESRWNPAAVNASYGATGLIQFLPSTARNLGTTVEDLAGMTRVEQLAYVLAYLRPYAGRIGTLSDLYMAVLRPTAIGKPDDFALITTEEGKAYTANKGLDLDANGQITKAEATAIVARRLDEGRQSGNVYDDGDAAKPAESIPEIIPKEDKRMDPLSLVSMLVSVFAPKVRAQADKVLGTDVGKPLVDTLLSMTQQLTGKADPLEAVAVARQNPEIVAKMEQATENWFAQVAPALERVAAIDRQDLQAADASRDSAAGRQDAADVRKRIDGKIWWAYAVAAVILAAIALTELVVRDEVDGQIVGALILAFGFLGGKIGDMVSYAFGSTAGSQAKDVVIGEAMRRQNNGAKS